MTKPLIALIAAADPPSLFERLDDVQRVGVLSALAIVTVAAGFLVLFTFACGRIARWYVNRKASHGPKQDRRVELEIGLDRKPRPRSKEDERWHQPP